MCWPKAFQLPRAKIVVRTLTFPDFLYSIVHRQSIWGAKRKQYADVAVKVVLSQMRQSPQGRGVIAKFDRVVKCARANILAKNQAWEEGAVRCQRFGIRESLADINDPITRLAVLQYFYFLLEVQRAGIYSPHPNAFGLLQRKLIF